MKAVVCFYEKNQALYSENYIFLTATENLFEFLADIEKKYFNQMKVVQIDFEATSAAVFILNDYKIISASEIESAEKISIAFASILSKNIFIKKVEAIKKQIAVGRYYQVNFTSGFIGSSDEDSFTVFKKYYSVFKSRYFAFLPMKNFEILCFSPELFLEKKESMIRTQPIKGTLTSSLNNLITSTKETAELSMIVDLLRNDLNAVCEKPVRVTQHRELLNLGYTQHTYSEIMGETNFGMTEILKLTFPGGSISGCPKIESLKAISAFEDRPRGFYTGSIGWWQKNNFKLNIAIRSFKKESSTMTYYAGCGIVYDSAPENEWLEFLTKAGMLNLQHD